MNSTDHSSKDPELSALLREWKVSEAPAPGFNDRVWRRIARAEETAQISVWDLLVEWVSRTFARPSLAVSYVTALVALGLLAGYLEGNRQNTRTDQQLSTRYVQMMNPYQLGR